MEKNESTKGDECIMVFGDLNYEDHLVRNPNDYQYQSALGTWADTQKLKIQTAVDNIVQNAREYYDNYKQDIHANNVMYGDTDSTLQGGVLGPLRFNVQTAVDNIVQNAREYYDNYKQDIRANNVMYGDTDSTLQHTLSQPVEKLNYLYDNQDLSLQPYLEPAPNPINLIHEELAEKEKRIRELENSQVENIERITQLENGKLEDRKKIQKLSKKIEKLQKNPLVKWWERAIEDSKKERII